MGCKNEVPEIDNFHGSFNAYHQYVSKYKILGKYLQPFSRYSTKEKPEVPKCQMLAANILKLMSPSHSVSWKREQLVLVDFVNIVHYFINFY